jgi:NAD(P)-dependent dehydrogenase (short-subunit alcohol dehydrogenase family)
VSVHTPQPGDVECKPGGWLNGVVALVTGGAGGIGRAVIKRFVSEGAKVGVLDRDAQALTHLGSELGANVVTVAGDVLSIADTQKALQEVLAAYGHLDTFVGNAGQFDYFQRFEEADCNALVDGFDEMFDTNVKAYLIGARVTAPELRATGGSMIFTVSNSGLYAGGGGVLYVSSKHAVVGLIRQLAYEMAPDVRVNGVSPGATLTDLKGLKAFDQASRQLGDESGLATAVSKAVPLGFVARPEDHAGHYVLLASKANSRATTGAILTSDGGMEVRGGGRRRSHRDGPADRV